MSKRYCKEHCDFLHDSLGEKPKCLIYKKKLKPGDDGWLRLKKCVRESREYKIRMQQEDIKTFYDSFVCEMDFMFDRLDKLIKGEK
jgi:hypothetical protein